MHSPRHRGFFYSHVGWIFDCKHRTLELAKVADLARYPELIWLHKFALAPPIVLTVLCFIFAGGAGLVVGFFWSTVAVYHATFCINSLAHGSGSKRYETGDDSRNNWILALFTMGEGWHNNHHAYQSSARQGFRWWEIDLTYYILLALSRLGIIWRLKMPPEEVLRNEQRLGSRVIARAAEKLAAAFNSESIALAAIARLRRRDLSVLQEYLQHTPTSPGEVLTKMYLPGMPSREELVTRAKAMFVRNRSLDDIVDRAHELLFASVVRHLARSPESGLTTQGRL